jgi:gas vesicle protein
MARDDERSLSDLQEDAQRNRAEFVQTVDQLRSKVADTVSDMRARVSPDAIKAGASDYFRARSEDLVDKARRNPLQAAAIGLGVGYPLFRIARSIPAPVLMVGAGLYLLGSSSAQNASRKLGQNASRKLGGVADQISEQVGAGAEAVRQNVHDVQGLASDSLASARAAVSSGVGSFKDQTSAAGAMLADALNQAMDGAANFANSASDSIGDIKQKAIETFAATSDAVRERAATTSSFVQDTAGGVTEYGADTAYKIRDRAVETSQRATSIISQTLQRNPLLVGGVGLAIGMLIASALPQSDIEKGVLNDAGAQARKQANDLASKGFDAAKGIAVGVLADVAEQAVREGLSTTDLNATVEDLGRRVRKVAESATGAAFGATKTNDAA